jgi:transposase-like protein
MMHCMKKILVCPVCKSTDVELDTGGYTGKYICKECGYVGFAIEVDYEEMKKSEEIKRIYEKKKKDKPQEEEHRRRNY